MARVDLADEQDMEDYVGGVVMQMCMRINGSREDKAVAEAFFPKMIEAGFNRTMCEDVAENMLKYQNGVCATALKQLIVEHFK